MFSDKKETGGQLQITSEKMERNIKTEEMDSLAHPIPYRLNEARHFLKKAVVNTDARRLKEHYLVDYRSRNRTVTTDGCGVGV